MVTTKCEKQHQARDQTGCKQADSLLNKTYVVITIHIYYFILCLVMLLLGKYNVHTNETKKIRPNVMKRNYPLHTWENVTA